MLNEKSKPQVVIYTNPSAGKTSRYKRRINQLCQKLSNANIDYILYSDSKFRQGVKYSIIAGGDGTINKVLSSFLKTREPSALPHHQILIFPCGSGNDFSRSLSELSFNEFAKQFNNKEDQLSYSGKYIKAIKLSHDPNHANSLGFCLNMSLLGFGGLISHQINSLKNRKPNKGKAYLQALLASIPHINPFEVEVNTCEGSGKGHQHFFKNAINVSIANGQRCGRNLRLAEKNYIYDERMQITVIKDCSMLRRLILVGKLILGLPLSGKYIWKCETKQASINCVHGIQPMDIDGEPAEVKKIKFESVPTKLAVKKLV